MRNAKDYKIDLSNIFMAGLSSGANCVIAINYLSNQSKDFTIKHQSLLNGYYDLNHTNHDCVFRPHSITVSGEGSFNKKPYFLAVLI